MTIPKQPLINDPTNMFELMDSWPKLIDYLAENLDFSSIEPLKQNASKFQSITIIGMGGSGISGDIISEFFQPYVNIPITVIKDYSLPPYINEHALVIILSYSGNTEETIQGFKQAHKKHANIIAVSSNGQIETLCKEYGHTFFKVPNNYQPRAALPLLLFPALLSLQILFPTIPSIDLEAIKTLFEETQQQAKTMANHVSQFQNKIAFIYAASPFHSIGYRFQCQLNENSKTHAAFFPVPEQNHNAIVPFQVQNDYPLLFIFLRHKHENQRNTLRLNYMEQFLKEKKMSTLTFRADDHNDPFLDALALLYQLDYLSIYLAHETNNDPTDITAINGLKQFLKTH